MHTVCARSYKTCLEKHSYFAMCRRNLRRASSLRLFEGFLGRKAHSLCLLHGRHKQVRAPRQTSDLWIAHRSRHSKSEFVRRVCRRRTLYGKKNALRGQQNHTYTGDPNKSRLVNRRNVGHVRHLSANVYGCFCSPTGCRWCAVQWQRKQVINRQMSNDKVDGWHLYAPTVLTRQNMHTHCQWVIGSFTSSSSSRLPVWSVSTVYTQFRTYSINQRLRCH